MNSSIRQRAVELGLLARLTEFGLAEVRDTTSADTAWVDRAAVRSRWEGPPTQRAGCSRSVARITAVLGALEGVAARWGTSEWILASSARLAATGHDVWGGESFPGAGPAVDDHDPTCWVRGTVLGPADRNTAEAGRVWLPADLVYEGGDRPVELAPTAATAGRTGLAVHFDRWSAIAAGLNRLATLFAVGATERSRPVPVTLDPAGLPRSEAELLCRFDKAGTPAVLTMTLTPLGTPLFAVSRDTAGGRRIGYGFDPIPSRAVRRALLALAEGGEEAPPGGSRLAGTSGASSPVPWPAVEQAFAGADLPAREHAGFLRRALSRMEVTRIAVVDLPAWPGIRAVRVVAPGITTGEPAGQIMPSTAQLGLP